MTRRASGWMSVWLCAALGCGGDEAGAGRDVGEVAADVTDADGDGGAAAWEVAITGLPGALLSVWGDGASELWAVGVDAGDGSGPMVVRGTPAGGWERADLRSADPDGGHLWWVFGPDATHLWIVGERGRVLRVTHGADGVEAVERIDAGTDATLYGVWGTSEDDLWAVGGYVYPRTGPPTIVRLSRAGGEVVALPDGVADKGTFFKVWGAAADDVWVVGEAGMVLHWDGAKWAMVPVAGTPRLVTVHGRGADDLTAVGGTSSGVILEGRAFAARAAEPFSPLNGVFVAAGGAAWAVGMQGQVLRREGVGAAWQAVATGLPLHDWHAVWVDARGDTWAVGGDLLTRLDQGTLVRFGPARADLPRGEVRGLGPAVVEEAVAEEAAEDVEVIDDGADASDAGEVADAADAGDSADAGDAEAIDASGDGASEVVETDSGPDSSDAGDAEVAPDTVDAGDTGDTSDAADATDDVDASDSGDTSAGVPFELGHIEAGSGTFAPYAEDMSVGIQHGPQGGIHVEAVVRWACTTEALDIEADFDLRLVIDGAEVARFVSANYPVPVVSPGVCQSYTMPVQFDVPDSTLWDGKAAHLTAKVSPPGASWTRELDLLLYDTL